MDIRNPTSGCNKQLANVYMIGKMLMGFLLIIYAYAMVKILGRIQQLKNK